MQTFIDFSATETNVHYLEHSHLLPPGPYSQLHSEVVQTSKAFMSAKEVDAHTACIGLTSDLKFLGRVFLPCTQRAVGEVYGQYEMELWRDHFRVRYLGQWTRVPSILREDVAETHLNSAFGAMLFEFSSGAGARATIRQFIEYLLAEDSANLSRIERVNELSESLEGRLTLEDEELEFRMKQCGLDLAAVQRTDVWKSLSEDLGAEDMAALLQAIDDFY